MKNNIPPHLSEEQIELKEIKSKKTEAIKNQQYEEASKLRDLERDFERRIELRLNRNIIINNLLNDEEE